MEPGARLTDVKLYKKWRPRETLKTWWCHRWRCVDQSAEPKVDQSTWADSLNKELKGDSGGEAEELDGFGRGE